MGQAQPGVVFSGGGWGQRVLNVAVVWGGRASSCRVLSRLGAKVIIIEPVEPSLALVCGVQVCNELVNQLTSDPILHRECVLVAALLTAMACRQL